MGPKQFVKAVLRHRSDKNPVQRCLDIAANEVLAFRKDAYDASEWSTEDKGELLNMALGAVHMQCIDAGVCYAQTGHSATLVLAAHLRSHGALQTAAPIERHRCLAANVRCDS